MSPNVPKPPKAPSCRPKPEPMAQFPSRHHGSASSKWHAPFPERASDRRAIQVLLVIAASSGLTTPPRLAKSGLASKPDLRSAAGHDAGCHLRPPIPTFSPVLSFVPTVIQEKESDEFRDTCCSPFALISERLESFELVRPRAEHCSRSFHPISENERRPPGVPASAVPAFASIN